MARGTAAAVARRAPRPAAKTIIRNKQLKQSQRQELPPSSPSSLFDESSASDGDDGIGAGNHNKKGVSEEERNTTTGSAEKVRGEKENAHHEKTKGGKRTITSSNEILTEKKLPQAKVGEPKISGAGKNKDAIDPAPKKRRLSNPVEKTGYSTNAKPAAKKDAPTKLPALKHEPVEEEKTEEVTQASQHQKAGKPIARRRFKQEHPVKQELSDYKEKIKAAVKKIRGTMKKQAPLILKLPKVFSLQSFFESSYEDNSMDVCFLFRSLDGFDGHVPCSARIWRPWKIQWAGDEVKGDFSRVVYSQAWEQIENLLVKTQEKMHIRLFQKHSNFLLPRTNDELHTHLCRCCRDETKDLDGKIDAFYEALGRMMARVVLNPSKQLLLIANWVLPKLLRNYLFKGISPTNSASYDLGMLMDHARELIAHNFDEGALITEKMLYQWYSINQGDEHNFRVAVEKEVINSRSKALGAMKKGFTLNGTVQWQGYFCDVSFECIERMFFAKPSVDISDFYPSEVSSLSPIFKQTYKDNDGISPSEKMPAGQLLKNLEKALREGAEDPGFLSHFLSSCTGQSYLPYLDTHVFSIYVEFDYSLPEDYLPMVYAIEQTIIFPGSAYGGDRQKFEEKLKYLMADETFTIEASL